MLPVTLALSSSPTALHTPKPGTIAAIDPGSIAEALGLTPGDRLLSVNGHVLRDVIDYRFYSAAEHVALEVERHGKRKLLQAEKDPDEPLGIDFGVALFDDITRCNNNCYFCFIGGNRKGMRRTLFIKDDDYRLSFLFGNFATLTNLTEEDWARIQEQRLSPLYISVHATDLELRRQLLANPKAGDILGQLDELASMHIQTHCQLVVCPGLNDGEHLDRSVKELAGRYPWVQTIAVVPVGLTEMNQVRGAHKLKVSGPLQDQLCTPEYAQTILAQMRPFQQRYLKEYGTPLVYPSDEYYLLAGEPSPAAKHYGDYPQFENGVGMVRFLLDDWSRVKRRLLRAGTAGPPRGLAQRMTLVSGTLIAPVLGPLVRELAALTGIEATLAPVANRTYGASITCSGLLAARDIIAGLEGQPLGDLVVLPRYALDDAGEVFLDDLTPQDMERELGRPVIYVRNLSDLFPGYGNSRP